MCAQQYWQYRDRHTTVADVVVTILSEYLLCNNPEPSNTKKVSAILHFVFANAVVLAKHRLLVVRKNTYRSRDNKLDIVCGIKYY